MSPVPPERGKSIHKMMLRGHWEISRTAEGFTRHTRRFGRPRTLDANETVHVTCTRVPEAACVYVNEVRLGTVQVGEPFDFDITSALSIRNALTIEFTQESPTGQLGETAIEIVVTG